MSWQGILSTPLRVVPSLRVRKQWQGIFNTPFALFPLSSVFSKKLCVVLRRFVYRDRVFLILPYALFPLWGFVCSDRVFLILPYALFPLSSVFGKKPCVVLRKFVCRDRVFLILPYALFPVWGFVCSDRVFLILPYTLFPLSSVFSKKPCVVLRRFVCRDRTF